MTTTPINILIVDDEPKNLTVLETVLDDPGYRLVRAESADEALLALMAEEFGLLILDIRMPGMTGFELAQMVKQRKKTARIPIIFLTAYYNEDQHVLEGYETGAVDYLHKPVNPAMLRSKVAVFAELHRASRELGQANQALLAEVSERRRAEQNLSALNEILELRVAERTQALRESEQFVRAQNDVLERIAKGESLADCLDALCLAIERIDPRLRACLLVGDDDRQCLSSVIAPRMPQFADAIRRADDGRLGPCAEVIAGGQTLACPEMANDARWSDAWRSACQAHGIRAAYFTPIVETGGLPRGGVMLCFADPQKPTEQDLQIAEMAAGLASIVLRRDQTDAALKDADRRKDEFLAMLAHELRNPLAPIHNAVHLLRVLAPHEPALDDARDMIDRQVNHLMHLVDDLLDVSRVSRGKIQLKTQLVDLGLIARQAVETSAPLIDARRHRLIVTLPDDPVPVEGDFTRLVQVISNLLNNAAKYTDEGGTIGLTVEEVASIEGQPREALVRVRDNGRGIDPPALKSLFDLFYQVDQNLDRSDGGLGIGLSLVKRLVEMHGGRVEVHSAGRGCGSEFVVRLPCLTETALDFTPKPPRFPDVATPKLRILVVDDNHDSADSLSMLLRIDGHQVWTAYDGGKAIEVALAEQIAVILLDIGLPYLDGYQACRAMREGGLTSALIVAMTGYGQVEDQQRSLEAGFDAHLVKPVDFATIRELLARRPVMIC